MGIHEWKTEITAEVEDFKNKLTKEMIEMKKEMRELSSKFSQLIRLFDDEGIFGPYMIM